MAKKTTKPAGKKAAAKKLTGKKELAKAQTLKSTFNLRAPSIS